MRSSDDNTFGPDDHDAITRAVYENPTIVDNYAEARKSQIWLLQPRESFAQSLPGSRVLDLGCGPGIDSWFFASRGLAVVGVDRSGAMIRRARGLMAGSNSPTFVVGDILQLRDMFPAASFDGIWCAASLLHVARAKASLVVDGLHCSLASKGKLFLSVKEGTGEELLVESKYGTPAGRYFVYWQEDNLLPILTGV